MKFFSLDNRYICNCKIFQFDFWLEPRKVGLPVDVLVPPTKKQFFQYFLRTNGIQHEIKIENAQKLIDEEQKRMATRSTKQVEWTDYHTLDEVGFWRIQRSQTIFTEMFVKTFR